MVAVDIMERRILRFVEGNEGANAPLYVAVHAANFDIAKTRLKLSPVFPHVVGSGGIVILSRHGCRPARHFLDLFPHKT